MSPGFLSAIFKAAVDATILRADGRLIWAFLRFRLMFFTTDCTDDTDQRKRTMLDNDVR